MMKKLVGNFLLSFLLASCCSSLMSSPECNNDDLFNFRLVNSNGEYYFSGIDPREVDDRLEVYTINGGKRYDASISYESDRLTASIGHQFSEVIIEIDDVEKARLFFALTTTDDKCCGRQTRINTVTVANTIIEYHYYEVVQIEIVD